VTDAIDLSTVTILNSPDVRDWPVTAAITAIDCLPAGVNVEHSKRHGAGRWPEVPLDGDKGPVSFTLWFFKQIGGQWFGAAAFEFWETRPNTGDSIFRVLIDAFYDANRWGVLTGQAFAPGERAGFMVSAGDARPAISDSVHERSNIVTIDVPADGVGHFAFGEPPAELPTPEPRPEDDDAHPVEQLVMVLDNLIDTIGELKEVNLKLIARFDAAAKDGFRIHL
jgi:hypothetical protein